jgi:cytosine/adenosine deaminase-related metal-dependent hydrolase
MKTLIHGGYLIAMAGGEDVVADGGLVIEDDRIVTVGTADRLAPHRADAQRIIDARGHAILPGLVNTHTHLAGALTKALTEDVPTYGGPFRIALGMHENVIAKEDILLPGMVHGVEMLKTGTTTINECWWHQPQSSSIEKAVRPNLSESFMLMHEVAPGEEVLPLDGPNQWPREPPASARSSEPTTLPAAPRPADDAHDRGRPRPRAGRARPPFRAPDHLPQAAALPAQPTRCR